MPPKAEKKTTTTTRTQKKTVDENMEVDTSISSSPVPRQKGKLNVETTQPTLDKHLKTCSAQDELHQILKNVSDKLGNLASKEFIETKFKELITEEIMNKKLNDVKKEIKSEVKKEVDSVRKELKELQKKVNTQDGIIEELRNKVSDLEIKTETLQDQKISLATACEKMELALIEREVKIQSLERRNDDLEQYTRRNSVRIYGIADEKQESVHETCEKVKKLVNSKLGLSLSNTDVDIAHRIGKYQKDGNRVIICKFVQRVVKHEVLRARRKLKGTHFVIKEDLTAANAKLLESVSSHSKVKSAWSDEGRIIVLCTNNFKYMIKRVSDLDKVPADPKETVHHTDPAKSTYPSPGTAKTTGATNIQK